VIPARKTMFRFVCFIGLATMLSCGGSKSGGTETTSSLSTVAEVTVASISTSRGKNTTSVASTAKVTAAAWLFDGEPFLQSFDPAELPELPGDFPGHSRYEGVDAAGLSGSVRASEIRVFLSESRPEVIWDFATQSRRCGDTIWILRWRVRNPDVLVKASHELDGISGDEIVGNLSPWNAPAASAGLMSNSICLQPGFIFGGTINGNNSNLVDISLEWSFYDIDAFERPSEPATTTCVQYVYDDELPIEPCAEGYSVTLLQEELGLDPDGYFGPNLQAEVRRLREQFGLPDSAIVDAALWRRLGILSGAPYPDLNGDGVIDGSEMPFD
jgi:hypothetical protein